MATKTSTTERLQNITNGYLQGHTLYTAALSPLTTTHVTATQLRSATKAAKKLQRSSNAVVQALAGGMLEELGTL